MKKLLTILLCAVLTVSMAGCSTSASQSGSGDNSTAAGASDGTESDSSDASGNAGSDGAGTSGGSDVSGSSGIDAGGSDTSGKSGSDGSDTSGSLDSDGSGTADADGAGNSNGTLTTVEGLDTSDMFTDRDKETSYDEHTATIITLNGTSAQCDDSAVSIDGTTITLSAEGTYIISGTLTNGQIIIDADKNDKLQLVLDNADISCESSAAIYVRNADKVFLTLAPGSENTLATTGEFVAIDDNNIDGVIFSKDDLTLNGSGTLTVSSATGHGIVSKDDLVVTSGTYIIDAASHGLTGKDSVRILDGTYTLTTGKDGIHAENTEDTSLGFIYIAGGSFVISAQTDGLDSGSILQVDDGTFDMTTGGGSANASTHSDGSFNEDWGGWGRGRGGMEPSAQSNDANGKIDAAGQTDTVDKTGDAGNQTDAARKTVASGQADDAVDAASSSAKGLKAETLLLINSGTFNIDASDDALHTNGNLCICDGTFEISTGDDGMHADAQLVIEGGVIHIAKSYEGIEGMTIDINGGDITLVASDDGLNAAGGNDQSSLNGRPGQDNFSQSDNVYIRITGGKLNIDASGDGIDSNGNLYITGGETYVCGPTNSANGALDYDGQATISGGSLVAVGASGMAQNLSDAQNQGAILVNTSQTQAAGSTVTLSDSDGNTLITYTPAKQYNSVIISCPGITEGSDYELTMGTETTSITMDSLIYGTGSGMGMPGGMGGNDMRSGGMPSGDGTMPEDGMMPGNGTVPGDGTLPEGGSFPGGTAPGIVSESKQ